MVFTDKWGQRCPPAGTLGWGPAYSAIDADGWPSLVGGTLDPAGT